MGLRRPNTRYPAADLLEHLIVAGRDRTHANSINGFSSSPLLVPLDGYLQGPIRCSLTGLAAA